MMKKTKLVPVAPVVVEQGERVCAKGCGNPPSVLSGKSGWICTDCAHLEASAA